jgi:crotonobetainyl-CoA:carnitine CoA-transferase CaiB-like acyl-CoA transferase
LLGRCTSSSTEAELALALGESLGSLTLAEALGLLSAAGVPTAVARMPGELPDDAVLRDADMFATLHMQDGTPFFVPNRYARFSRTEECRVFEAPGIGEHSREVLAEAGLSELEIDALLETGVLKQGEPFRVVALQSYR